MPRIIAYARVSTDKQDAENQRFEIERFLERRQQKYDDFVEETISGKKQVGERKIGQLIQGMERGDTLIVSETSRISRRLVDVLNTVQDCIDRGITVIAVKENFEFGDDINSKVIAFAFGLAAEIERNLISARTREALARKRADGVKLGRPVGTHHAYHYKLHKHEAEIGELLLSPLRPSVSALARHFDVNRETMRRFIQDRGLRRKSIDQTGV